MMEVTITSFLTALIISSVIILIHFLLVKNFKIQRVFSANILMLISLLFLVRLCIPVEFFYTYTIPSKIILPAFSNLMKITVVNLAELNITVEKMLVFLWAIISFYFLIQYIHRIKSIHLLKKLFSTRAGFTYKKRKVIIVQENISPVVLGLIKPIILIPEAHFTDKEMIFILEHELFHISSFDFLIKNIYEIISIFYWWNPLIHLFRWQFSHIIELKADEHVIKNFDIEERINYVETLIKVSNLIHHGELSGYSHCLPAFGNSNPTLLFDRATNVLSNRKKRSTRLLILVFGGLFFYLSTCVIFEPYILDAEIEKDTFAISPSNSYLINNNDDSYSVYTDGEFLFEITNAERVAEFKDIKINTSIEED